MDIIDEGQLDALAAASKSVDGRSALLQDGLSAAAAVTGSLLHEWCVQQTARNKFACVL